MTPLFLLFRRLVVFELGSVSVELFNTLLYWEWEFHRIFCLFVLRYTCASLATRTVDECPIEWVPSDCPKLILRDRICLISPRYGTSAKLSNQFITPLYFNAIWTYGNGNGTSKSITVYVPRLTAAASFEVKTRYSFPLSKKIVPRLHFLHKIFHN